MVKDEQATAALGLVDAPQPGAEGHPPPRPALAGANVHPDHVRLTDITSQPNRSFTLSLFYLRNRQGPNEHEPGDRGGTTFPAFTEPRRQAAQVEGPSTRQMSCSHGQC